jgi:hypothetical protein
MIIQITDYGHTIIESNVGPIVLDVYKLGSDYNYVPQPTDTDIHGTEVFSGGVSVPDAVNANVVRYSMYLQYNLGPFDFGEIGIYYQGQLFALGAANALIEKLAPTSSSVGNSIRIDVYLSVTGTNYNMWLDYAESDNRFKMATLHSPDQLPPSHAAVPNAYIIQGADSSQGPCLAFTDRNGLWSFDAYQYATIVTGTITAVTSTSVDLSITHYSPKMNPSYFGEVVLEFITGELFSICRYVKTAVVAGNTVTLVFDTPLMILPEVGDKFVTFNRTQSSTTIPNIPQATATVLGGIKIGPGLTIAPDGVVSVDPLALSLVTSVNGQIGDVTINAGNLPDLAAVGITNDYNSLNNKPTPYSLPAMTTVTRGGARLPLNGNLITTGGDVLDLGFAPVKSVNSQLPDVDGNVNVVALVEGLIDPTEIPNGANLDTYTDNGLFFVVVANATSLTNAPSGTTGAATLEVVPLSTNNTGEVVQRWTTATKQWWRKLTSGVWQSWVEVGTGSIQIATSTVLGVVKIGSGLTIDGSGLLTINPPTLPIATSSILGAIRVGTGLAINSGTGVLSVDPANIAVATTSTLGVVKIGSGLAITSDGTLSSTGNNIATVSTVGVVKVGVGLSVDITGNLTSNLRTVNGISPDAGGNVVVSAGGDKLDRVNGTATGLFLAFLEGGNASTTFNLNVDAANVQHFTVTSGATMTWSFSGWPASTYAELQVELTNGGLRLHTFPGAVQWVNPDGSTTTSFATFMSNLRGATNFQAAGTDFVIFWSRDAGSIIYARVL